MASRWFSIIRSSGSIGMGAGTGVSALYNNETGGTTLRRKRKRERPIKGDLVAKGDLITKDERYKQRVKDIGYGKFKNRKTGKWRESSKSMNMAQGFAFEAFKDPDYGWERITTKEGKGWLSKNVPLHEISAGKVYPVYASIPLKRQTYGKRQTSQEKTKPRRIREIPQGARDKKEFERWFDKFKPHEREDWVESLVDTSKPPEIETTSTEVQSLTPTHSTNPKDYVFMRQTGFMILDKDWKAIWRYPFDDESIDDVTINYDDMHICLYPYFTPHDVNGNPIEFPDWLEEKDRNFMSNLSFELYGKMCIMPQHRPGMPAGDYYYSIAGAATPKNYGLNIPGGFVDMVQQATLGQPKISQDNFDTFGFALISGHGTKKQMDGQLAFDVITRNAPQNVMLPTFPETGYYNVFGEDWIHIKGTKKEEKE